jgi:hypothetical protein
VYQNGRRIEGLWKKPAAESMLMFIDSNGKAIPLAPGAIWVLYDTQLPE